MTRGFTAKRLSTLAAACLVCSAWPATAGVCSVPGSHSTIQGAVDDPICDTIELADQTYPESVHIHRQVDIEGPQAGEALIEGLLDIATPAAIVGLADLTISNGCEYAGFRARFGAQVTPLRVEVKGSAVAPCPPSGIFADGFESGDTDAWSNSVE